MALNTELVEALTPESPPPVIMEPPLSDERDEASQRRWLWTQFLLNGEFADQVLQASVQVEQAWYAGLGLIPWTGANISFERAPGMEGAARDSGYTWGGIVLTTLPVAPYVHNQDSGVLSFEERQFPIVVRHADYEPQDMEVQDSHGLLGTAACWARAVPRNNQIQGEGCLTAAHVLGSKRQALNVVVNGASLTTTIEAFAPPCLDTAFLRLNWPTPTPQSLSPLDQTSIAFGDPAGFRGAVTGPVSGHVTHLSAHARYSGSGVPRILCHDGLGAPGDSGALVRVHRGPAAMHLGKIILDTGAEESRGILLQQISHVMQLELFL